MSRAMCPSISLATSSTLYGRHYEAIVDLRWNHRHIKKNSWLIEVVTTFVNSISTETKSSAKFIYSLRHAFELISSSKSLKRFVNKSISVLDEHDLRYLFIVFESELKLVDMSERGKYQCSKDFRRVCISGLSLLWPDKNIHRKALHFKTSFVYPRRASTLISDAVMTNDAGDTQAPLGAMPHKTYQDLYLQTKQKISDDLDRVKQACIKDIKYFDGLRKKIIEIRKVYVSPELRSMIYEYSTSDDLDEFRQRRRSNYSDEEVLAAYYNVYEEIGGPALARIQPFYLSKLDDLFVRIFGDASDYFQTNRVYLDIPYRCASTELQSIYILLLCHTGWNAGSLMEMEFSQVEEEKKQWILQGFKDKTDDYTPTVFIDKTNLELDHSLKLLMWHRASLINHGLIGSADQYFWYCGPLKSSYCAQGVGIKSKKRFFQRHGMAPFSFNEIRNQVFEKDRLDGRNVESIRRKAGHRNRDTTVGYLDSLVSRRIFSSMNLEFSKRLENTVIFRLLESGLVNNVEYESSRVRTELFSPIGDGSYCIDVKKPPKDNEVFDGVCAALTCHCGDGCANRIIIIDDTSLEALVRKKHYYLLNWKRLESNNPAAFRKFHFDAMSYVLSLYDFIKKSRFNAYLLDVEARIGNG
jgi:hypothetical protein